MRTQTETATRRGTTPAATRKGMVTMTTTTRVLCPTDVACCAGKCGGEEVTATYTANQVRVDACSYLVAQGWTGAGLILTHNQALQYLVPAAQAAGVRHADGLVVIR